MKLRRLMQLLHDLVYVSFVLGITFLIVLLNGVFIANISNSLRMTGYLDPVFGIQVVMVLLSLVWAPIVCLLRLRQD